MDRLDFPGNAPVRSRLKELVSSKDAIAFVGAGASAGLYPLWAGLIERLMKTVSDNGYANEDQLRYLRTLTSKPLDAASELRKLIQGGDFAEFLRTVFSRQPGNAFTSVHGALLRAPFRGYVTTNYDPGLLEARREFRKGAREEGIATWQDRSALRAWLTDTIFARDEAPILFAHGLYYKPETIVLCSEDYDQAYRASEYSVYPEVIRKLWGQKSLVFVGWGFSDPWFDRIADDVLAASAADLSMAQHVALVGLSAEQPYTPQMRQIAERKYNAKVLFYRVVRTPDGEDHSALLEALEDLNDQAPAPPPPAPPVSVSVSVPASAGRLHEVLKRGVLRCGCIKHPPLCDFEFQGRTPRFSGLYVEMARAVGKNVGIEVEFAPVDWSELRDAFQPPLNLDLVMSILESRERRTFADFTAFFYSVGVGAIVKRGDERFQKASDLKGEDVCVVVTKGEIGWEYAVRELRLPRQNLTILESSDLTKMAALVVRGEADVVICDDVTCATMEQENPELQRIFKNRPLYLCNNAIMVPKNEPALAEWVQTEFERARESQEIREMEEAIFDAPDMLLMRFT
jgi:ABC-type amino acid transport substrate-binding protein